MTQAYDPSSSHDVDRRTVRLRLARRHSEAAFDRLMDRRDFRAFVWGLLAQTHVFETSFDPCPQVTAFREGERNVGLAVLDRVNRLCPERYRTMADEAARDGAAQELAAQDADPEDTAFGNGRQEDERQ
jgi:hypothetical protein